MNSQAVYRTDAGDWKIEKQTEGLYRVTSAAGSARRSAGYIEQVGSVWVALAGNRLDHCVEVGQSITFDRAAALLLKHEAA
ncbi:hypothetical protein GCM10022286_01080 [Gryllotalpicola daejeonensis]|uniref:Uncharacterized protein n=1 Tax=Gryllotalpicola daejeonensis TaxID=993087 RepID=A0ABP7ZD54_9MICO